MELDQLILNLGSEGPCGPASVVKLLEEKLSGFRPVAAIKAFCNAT